MTEQVTTKRLDLTGQICPWPVINTLKELRTMVDGETVEVLVDHAPSVYNIPDAAKREGHETLNTESLGDGVFKILIRSKRKIA